MYLLNHCHDGNQTCTSNQWIGQETCISDQWIRQETSEACLLQIESSRDIWKSLPACTELSELKKMKRFSSAVCACLILQNITSAGRQSVQICKDTLRDDMYFGTWSLQGLERQTYPKLQVQHCCISKLTGWFRFEWKTAPWDWDKLHPASVEPVRCLNCGEP